MVVHCKKWFDNEEWEEFLSIWHEVLYVPTEEVFQENWLAMRAKYGERLGFPVNYLEDEIIRLYSQKFIRCYTNQVQHFENTSTSRAESQNARLKAVLVSSIGKYIDNFSFQ